MKQIQIHSDQKYKELGNLYGLFFEDINHAADGGLYAELIQNRAFEYLPIDNAEYDSLTAWGFTEGLSVNVEEGNSAHINNPHHLIVSAKKLGQLINFGYGKGICLSDGAEYRLKLRARVDEPTSISVKLVADIDEIKRVNEANLENIIKQEKNGTDKTTLSSDENNSYKKNLVVIPDAIRCVSTVEKITLKENLWTEYTCIIKASETTNAAGFLIELGNEGPAQVDFDYISLFPVDTYKNRENGLRKDLVEALAAMKPKFLRFPGGCLVHDGALEASARNSMYRWKNSIGYVYDRPSKRNNWGYNQSLGLGYYEYFLLCEDLGCEPLPVVPAGFNPHSGQGCPMEELEAWVQEALDLIEFATGDVNSKWGRVRAEMGHVAPFALKYIAIGNEEIGDGFFERYPSFHEAIRKKYPEILIINSAGPFAVGEGTEAGWNSALKNGSDLVDEHYYSNPEWFLANMHHYDDYDSNGPKVFLGEYASWGNTYYNALVEAAYMTHLEKSQAVNLACYAPLFCNVDYKNWTPDMIFFDGNRLMKTPNYQVQKLFMENQGQTELKLSTEDLDEVENLFDNDGVYGPFTIAGNGTKGIINNIVIWDTKNNVELAKLDNLAIDNNDTHEILNINAYSYEIEFDYDRTEGRKGLNIKLADKGANCILWEFGGWDNWDCNIQYIRDGRGSTISHKIFHVEDIHYKLKIVVDGLSIKTYVNGELKNDVRVPQPEIEELYACASLDADDSTILKVVNLTGDNKKVEITGIDEKVETINVSELSGYGLSAENTLDKPDNILVKNYELTADELYSASGYIFTYSAHSLTVLRFK